MGYNQHQSFYLRDRWLGKGLRAANQDPRFFFKPDAFEKIGLGKNMVQSLQHWLLATEVAEVSGVGKKRELNLTHFGEWILKNDPSLKYLDTIAMLHYNVVSNIEPSSTWYWFFNHFDETVINREDLFSHLVLWVQERERRVVAESSIRRDIECMTKMYAATQHQEDPEDTLTSPFSKLKLLKEKNNLYFKNEVDIQSDDNLFIKYVFCKYSEKHDVFEISLEEIMNKEELLGKTFNMNASKAIDILLKLETDKIYKVDFIRTNNLDIVKLPRMTTKEFLDIY